MSGEVQVPQGNTPSPPPSHDMAEGWAAKAAHLKAQLCTTEVWVGDYDYKALCMPRLPCLPSYENGSRTIFFGLHDRMPILVAMLMGFQHALAMMGGVIVVPRILGGAGEVNLELEPDVRAYLISNALIVSGLMSIIQIVRIRLWKGYWIGTGLISMSGISFTFLPVAQAMFFTLRQTGECPPIGPCPEAYGKWLGTVMVGAFLEIALSFAPPRLLRKAFPPIVTGTTVFLIGAALIPTGLKNWAGGSGPCLDVKEIENLGGEVPKFMAELFSGCPTSSGPKPYPWGAPQWIGLGLFVFSIIIVIEIFGSPFLRNAQVMIGLVAGAVLSAILGYIDTDLIKAAPAITFPLVKTFKLGFYLPALIPVLISHLVSTVETLGDIAASSEASLVATDGPEFESRVQGGLLADGVNSLIAGLLTSSPTTTFSQNNGVIVMTMCANRSAGLWGAVFLILVGVIGKVGGLLVALPDAVLGGMTVFLFANVAVSGIRIFAGLSWTRRERFILSVALSLGLGVVVVPKAFIYFIPKWENKFADAIRQGVVMILETGYSFGALLAAVLNVIIPKEEEPLSPHAYLEEQRKRKAKRAATGEEDSAQSLSVLQRNAGNSDATSDADDASEVV